MHNYGQWLEIARYGSESTYHASFEDFLMQLFKQDLQGCNCHFVSNGERIVSFYARKTKNNIIMEGLNLSLQGRLRPARIKRRFLEIIRVHKEKAYKVSRWELLAKCLEDFPTKNSDLYSTET